MKDIRDYLHLYLGCEVKLQYSNPDFPLNGKIVALKGDFFNEWLYDATHEKLHDHKLLLRPLSDMTEEEIRDLFEYEKISKEYQNIRFTKEFSSTGVLLGIRIDYDVFMDDVDGLYPRSWTLYGLYPRSWTLYLHSMSANDFKWCLSRGFDLFGLIDSGLAIDKTKLK